MESINTTSVSNGTGSFPRFNNTTINGGIEQYEEHTGLRIFRLLLFSLITAASLIGNSVIFKAVRSMNFHKPFSYHLVANMAFAEILISLCLPFLMYSREVENHSMFLESITECVLNPLKALSLVAVTYSMATIACYRYTTFKKPLPSTLSRKVKIGIISCLWLIPAVICIPVFLGLRYENGKCALQPVFSHKTQVVTTFVLRFAVPYFVIVVSYGAVAGKLRRRIVRKATEERSAAGQSSTTGVEVEDQIEFEELAGHNKTEEEHLVEQQRNSLTDAKNRRCSAPENADAEKDLLRMIYAIILVFMICYFPYQAVFLWEHIAEVDSWQFKYHFLLRKYVFILTCLPSALHPVFYGTMNPFYAKAFSKIFLCK